MRYFTYVSIPLAPLDEASYSLLDDMSNCLTRRLCRRRSAAERFSLNEAISLSQCAESAAVTVRTERRTDESRQAGDFRVYNSDNENIAGEQNK